MAVKFNAIGQQITKNKKRAFSDFFGPYFLNESTKMQSKRILKELYIGMLKKFLTKVFFKRQITFDTG